MNMSHAEPASTGKRIVGGLVDLVVSFALIMVIGAFAGLGTTEVGDARVGASVNVEGMAFVYAAGLVFALFALMEWRLGKTPGKYLAKTKVVTAGDERPGLLAAVLRNLLRYIDGIAFYLVGLIVMAASKDRQRLGDMVAGTRVVDD